MLECRQVGAGRFRRHAIAMPWSVLPSLRSGRRRMPGQPGIRRLGKFSQESLNKGVNSEFDLSSVTLKQPSPGSQPEIRNSAPKTAEFR